MAHGEVESESRVTCQVRGGADHLFCNQVTKKMHFFPGRMPGAQPSPLGPAAVLLPVLDWAPADGSFPRSGTMKG